MGDDEELTLSPVKRYCLAAYFILIFLTSVIGDTTVLIASLKYKVFQLHEFLVIIIQNIAVCNLLRSLLVILLFKLPALLEQEWVLGKVLCHVSAFTNRYLWTESTLLVCALTTSKYLLLKEPLRGSLMTKTWAYFLCTATWICSLILPTAKSLIIHFGDNGNVSLANGNVSFAYETNDCEYKTKSDAKIWIYPFNILLLYVPSILVIYTSVHSVILLARARRVAKRSGEPVRWQGVTTVVLTAAAYIIISLPLIFTAEIATFDYHEQKGDITWLRVAVVVEQLIVIPNFFIYCLTVNSFRVFLRARLQMLKTAIGLTPKSENVKTQGKFLNFVTHFSQCSDFSRFHTSHFIFINYIRSTDY